MNRDLEIVIASSNKHKIDEYRRLFAHLPVKLYSLEDLDIKAEIEETALSFKDNSLLKALEIRKHTDKVILSDDSGLEVHALDNFPGIYSSRFMADASYEMKCRSIIDRLRPFKDKTANFTCVITILGFSSAPQFFESRVVGKIADEPKGNSGFGYDPIFYYPKLRKTFGEFSLEDKNKHSHRARATEKAIRYLEGFLMTAEKRPVKAFSD